MRVAALAAIAIVGPTACTTPTTTLTTTSSSPTINDLPATVHFDGVRFDVGCEPVAEALVDIELPHAGQPKLRAIAGLWDRQAVAVLAYDPKGCGLWTLAIARGLSGDTETQIRDEVARGVEAFGVTASPVPRDDAGG